MFWAFHSTYFSNLKNTETQFSKSLNLQHLKERNPSLSFTFWAILNLWLYGWICHAISKHHFDKKVEAINLSKIQVHLLISILNFKDLQWKEDLTSQLLSYFEWEQAYFCKKLTAPSFFVKLFKSTIYMFFFNLFS